MVGSRCGWTAPTKDRADYIVRAQSTIISFTALILAFSLVQVQGNLRQTQELVDKEAGYLNMLDRQLVRFGTQAAAALRPLLWDYAASVIRDEWPSLRGEQLSDRTSQLLRPLSKGVFALEPGPGRQQTIYADMLQSLDAMADAREQRLSASSLRLTPAFWYLAFALIVVMVGLSALIEPVGFHMVSVAVQGLAIALLASLVFISDRPFKGDTSVPPTPFERALVVMKTRT
jgi:hypothetical protein